MQPSRISCLVPRFTTAPLGDNNDVSWLRLALRHKIENPGGQKCNLSNSLGVIRQIVAEKLSYDKADLTKY